MKRIVSLLSVIVASLACANAAPPPPGTEFTPADVNKRAAILDKQGADSANHQRLFAAIAKQTGVPVETLKTQKTQSGLGFGGLCLANLLAKETGKTFDQIVTLSKAGKGWGEIAKELNVHLGRLANAARKASYDGDGPQL